MAQRQSESASHDGGDKRWAVLLGTIGVAVTVSPFLAGEATSGWIILALGVGGLFIVAALAVASDADLEGPPPRRTG